MSNFDSNKYKTDYNKSNYTACNIRFRDREAAILTEYSQNLGISKNALLQKCLVYCYENYIDVSSVKLSTPEKQAFVGVYRLYRNMPLYIIHFIGEKRLCIFRIKCEYSLSNWLFIGIWRVNIQKFFILCIFIQSRTVTISL